jgi:lipopolysaccharide export system permease protein
VSFKRRSLVTPLDGYVAREFVRIFIATALGSPVLVFVIDLVDNLRKYQERKLEFSTILLSYLYWIPDTLFMVLPAATLFATVFSIGTFTRYSEISAAKASGISFYRFIAPIMLMATFAAGLGLVLGEVAPPANKKHLELLQGENQSLGTQRFNFVFANEVGRVYRVQALDVPSKAMEYVEVEERGSTQRPGLLVSSRTADWHEGRGWALRTGMLHVIPDETRDIALGFDSLYDRAITEAPQELQATERQPEEMNFAQLTRFIQALERSGADVNTLRVDRMLKIAIPVTCIIIALFGAPLATSSQRGGAAFGVAVSLATTVIFLVMIQMTKAIGGKGLIPPEAAAWMPNAIVGFLALILLARVRT